MMVPRQVRAEERTHAGPGAAVAGSRLSLEPKAPRAVLRQRLFPAGLALLLGGLILWLAVPRLLASAWLVARDSVLQQIDAGEPVAEADLLALIASRELALGWVEDRETHDQRATALAELALRGDLRSAAGTDGLERAVGATRAALAVAPADPRNWMQLGYLLVVLEGQPNRATAAALLLSIRTGPYQAPDFLRRRLFWVLAHGGFYDEEERGEVDRQIRLAWRTAPGALADLTLDAPDFFVPVAAALETVPGARERFLAALAFASPSGR